MLPNHQRSRLKQNRNGGSLWRLQRLSLTACFFCLTKILHLYLFILIQINDIVSTVLVRYCPCYSNLKALTPFDAVSEASRHPYCMFTTQTGTCVPPSWWQSLSLMSRKRKLLDEAIGWLRFEECRQDTFLVIQWPCSLLLQPPLLY